MQILGINILVLQSQLAQHNLATEITNINAVQQATFPGKAHPERYGFGDGQVGPGGKSPLALLQNILPLLWCF